MFFQFTVYSTYNLFISQEKDTPLDRGDRTLEDHIVFFAGALSTSVGNSKWFVYSSFSFGGWHLTDTPLIGIWGWIKLAIWEGVKHL